MKISIPILKLSKVLCPEDLSPRSEELREGIETKQSPFLFQTNRTQGPDKDTWKMSPTASPEKDPCIRIVELQKKEIVQLKESNREIQKKVESIERELKSLKRLRILLREKDRKIKEVEDNLTNVVNSIKSSEKEVNNDSKILTSQEFYLKNPPRRVWTNPVPLLYSQVEHLKTLILPLCK